MATYKQILQKQIQELEQKIESFEGEKTELINQLNQLRLAEFEDDMREESDTRQLLKG